MRYLIHYKGKKFFRFLLFGKSGKFLIGVLKGSVLFLFPLITSAQNLVPNPGFESHEGCPDDKTNFPLKFVKDWEAQDYEDSSGYSFTHSPDFFHRCAKNRYGQPHNFLGTEKPYKGSGYAGIFVFKVQTREYLQVKLKKPLKDGHSYYVKIQVSLADRCVFGVNKMVFLLSFEKKFLGYIKNYSQLQPLKGNPFRTLNQKKGWTIISGCYKAEGGETFLTIGNFNKDSQTPRNWVKNTTDQKTLKRSYYFVDEVSVLPCKNLKDCPCKKKAYEDISTRLEKVAKNQDTARLNFVDIYFDTDKARIVNDSYKILNKISDFLKSNKAINLTIEGHTDNRGSERYNQKLSRKRAKAVYDYLSKKGISQDRMKFKGLGAKEPVGSNETPRGRKLNRRVEFILKNSGH